MVSTWSPVIDVPGVDRRDIPYAFEVFFQCRTAVASWTRALAILEKLPGQGKPAANFMDEVFVALGDIQSFLAAVGVLSDLFFPGDRGSPDRGARLRELYEVGLDSPLGSENMKVRNRLIHIDEKLDRWLKGKEGRQLSPFSIEPWTGDAPDPKDAQQIRIVDNKDWRLLVFGESLELAPLIREVQRVATKFGLVVSDPAGVVATFRLEIGAPESP